MEFVLYFRNNPRLKFWLIGPKNLMQTYISRYTLGVFQTFPQFIRRSLSKPVFSGHWFIPAEGFLLIQVSLHPYAPSLASTFGAPCLIMKDFRAGLNDV